MFFLYIIYTLKKVLAMGETLKKLKKILRNETQDLFVVNLSTKEIVCMSTSEWKMVKDQKTHLIIV